MPPPFRMLQIGHLTSMLTSFFFVADSSTDSTASMVFGWTILGISGEEPEEAGAFSFLVT